MAGVWAILTAAGESTRMGRLKPLLPWCGATLIECQVSTLADAGAAHVVVVVGHEADAVIPYVAHPRASYVVNPDFLSGKATSVRAGLRAVSECADRDPVAGGGPAPSRDGHFAGDRGSSRGRRPDHVPQVRGTRWPPSDLCGVAAGRAGGPFSEETEGIREVFQAHRHEVNEVPIDDPVVRLDLNTPEDYERARRLCPHPNLPPRGKGSLPPPPVGED